MIREANLRDIIFFSNYENDGGDTNSSPGGFSTSIKALMLMLKKFIQDFSSLPTWYEFSFQKQTAKLKGDKIQL
jgi:hypothetical protein